MMQSSEVQIAEITEKMLNVSTLGALLFNVFLVAVVPALGEELFFRGTIQRLLSDWKGALFAIWITAFVFSAIHMQFYGFLPRMLLGAFLGYLLLWSGSLWLPIIAHFVNNSVAVVFYYLKFNGVKVIDVETIGTDDTLWLGIVSGIVCVFLGFLIRKNTRKPTSEIQL
jgi:membrane protease YdiL (CAAX protease family)